MECHPHISVVHLHPNSLDQLFWISRKPAFHLKYVSLCSLFIVVCPKFEFREGFVKVEKFFCIFPAFELPLDSHFNLRLFGFKAFPLHPYLLSLKVSNFLLKASRCKNPSTRADAEEKVSFRLITPPSLSGRRSWSCRDSVLERAVFHTRHLAEMGESKSALVSSPLRAGADGNGLYSSRVPVTVDHFLPKSHFNSVSMLQLSRVLRAESTLSAQSSAPAPTQALKECQDVDVKV